MKKQKINNIIRNSILVLLIAAMVFTWLYVFFGMLEATHEENVFATMCIIFLHILALTIILMTKEFLLKKPICVIGIISTKFIILTLVGGLHLHGLIHTIIVLLRLLSTISFYIMCFMVATEELARAIKPKRY